MNAVELGIAKTFSIIWLSFYDFSKWGVTNNRNTFKSLNLTPKNPIWWMGWGEVKPKTVYLKK